ncbi:hypothetical protein [Pedobacter foliorum]
MSFLAIAKLPVSIAVACTNFG